MEILSRAECFRRPNYSHKFRSIIKGSGGSSCFTIGWPMISYNLSGYWRQSFSRRVTSLQFSATTLLKPSSTHFFIFNNTQRITYRTFSTQGEITWPSHFKHCISHWGRSSSSFNYTTLRQIKLRNTNKTLWLIKHLTGLLIFWTKSRTSFKIGRIIFPFKVSRISYMRLSWRDTWLSWLKMF